MSDVYVVNRTDAPAFAPASATNTERPTTRISHHEMQQHIVRALAAQESNKGTGQLDRNKQNGLPGFPSTPYGLGVDGAASFVPLPLKAESRRGFTWLVELQGFGRASVGIYMLGDVVLGVARANCAFPDLDLAAYD